MNENEAFFILSAIPGLGANKIRHLVDLFGSAAAALSATAKEISAIAGCEKLALSWKSWEDNTTWEQELTAATKIGIQLIPFTHPLYPKSLRNTPLRARRHQSYRQSKHCSCWNTGIYKLRK